MTPLARIISASALFIALAAPAQAAEPAEDDLDALLEQATQGASLGGWADREAEREPDGPWIEHHGYFRFRLDLFYKGHLGTVVPGEQGSGTSAIPAPLRENWINNSDLNPFGSTGSDDATTLSAANLRFRYSPTIHIDRSIRIKTTIDFLDNLVLGSTPDFAGNLERPDVPLVAFTGAQASPSAGINSAHDAVRVKEAYAEWQPIFLLRLGRQASDWGLGLLANAGDGIDDDYGDYTDRALLLLKIFDVYVEGAWDFVYSGATTDNPAELFGQPKDLGGADDVQQWVISLFQRPLSEQELAKRRVDLHEHRRPAFDWGLYTVIRKQEMDLAGSSYDLLQSGAASYDQLQLVPRRALAVMPDLWLRYEQRFSLLSLLRIELEAVGVFGKVENVSDEVGADEVSRKLQQFGAALEAELQYGDFSLGVDGGFASGDDAEGFGVSDRPALDKADGTPNHELTAFKFDRDYHVDLLLFREVIGTVTNAWYIKPYLAYDVFDSIEDDLGARLDLLFASAAEPQATPGKKPFLGAEIDLSLFYRERDRFSFDVEAGFLFPGAAFDYISPEAEENNRNASFAFTIQSRLTLQF